jgi:hypothetical protein
MQVDLFTEMNAAAEALTKASGENRVPSREDLQLEFREILHARLPKLSQDEWLELFGLWHDDYLAGVEAARSRAFERLKACIAREAPKHPGSPFVCPCGEVCDPLGDPDFGSVHGPHIYEAQFDRPARR